MDEEVEVEEEEEEVEQETAAGAVILIEQTRELKSCARPVRPPAHAESISVAMFAVDRRGQPKRAPKTAWRGVQLKKRKWKKYSMSTWFLTSQLSFCLAPLQRRFTCSLAQ